MGGVSDGSWGTGRAFSSFSDDGDRDLRSIGVDPTKIFSQTLSSRRRREIKHGVNVKHHSEEEEEEEERTSALTPSAALSIPSSGPGDFINHPTHLEEKTHTRI